MLSFIINLLSSPFIGAVTNVLNKRVDAAVETHKMDTAAATQMVVAQMQAEIEARKAQSAMSSRHDWIVSWLGGAFVFHVFMIVLDSVFHLNWNVSALPKPMDEWEGQIILALCCVGPTTNIVNRVVGRVWK